MALGFFWVAHFSALSQKDLVDVIVQTDTLRSSESAFRKLDSIYNNKFIYPKERVVLLERLAQRSLEINDYAAMTKYSMEGVGISRTIKNDSTEAYFFKMLGLAQVYSEKPEQAVRTWKRGAALAENSNHLALAVTLFNNVGGASIDLNQWEEAEYYLLKSINLCDKVGPSTVRVKGLSMRLLATLYDRIGQREKVEPLFKQVHDIAISLADTNLICSYLNFHANYLFNQGKTEEALIKTEEALRYIEPYGDKNSLMTTLIFYSNLLASSGKHKEAFENYVRLYSLHKEIYDEENQWQINELETKFKTREIEEEKKLAEAQSLNEKRQKENYFLILIAVAAISLLLILLVYIVYNKRNTQLKNKLQEANLEAIIVGQEQERSRIAKELHDGIVQDLTALKMQLVNSESVSEAKNRLDVITKEVREISYQMMPITLRDLGLVKAIHELLERSFVNFKISYQFQHFEESERFSEKIETSLYRICQELINNVLKHSEASHVSLILRKSESHLILIFEDNGRGFDTNSIKKGIGINSLESRISFLKGSLEFDSSLNDGTTAMIKIPIQQG